MLSQTDYELAAVDALAKAKAPGNNAERFLPLDWQRAPYADPSPILLLTGSAGGGKSRLAGQIMHRDMLLYPGAQGLILRKTRESMNNSTVLFYEREIVGKDARVRHNRGLHRFEYANDSIVAYGGMKDEEQREQIRSIGQAGGLDRVWLEEANRFDEGDFNEILARMRGIATPYTQIILTTNPDSPTHFIKTRLMDDGQAVIYFSGAVDNTYLKPQYIDTLAQMTGIQALRLREGKWIQSEGAVFDNWDFANSSDKAEYNAGLPVIWGVDDGYAEGQGVGKASYHPRVVLFAQETATGGFHVFDEYYATQQLSEVTIAECLARPYRRPEAAYTDSSAAELRGRLWSADIMTVAATHPVHEGIKNLRRLICDGNGVRQFRIHPRCVQLAREMASYRYDDASRVANIGEPKPLKLDDHGCLVAGTQITTDAGQRPIETMRVGDKVLTRQGYQTVNACGLTAAAASTMTVIFSDGSQLTGTGNHPLWVASKGYIALNNLSAGDIISPVERILSGETPCQEKRAYPKPLSSTGLFSGATPIRNSGRIATTIARTLDTYATALTRFIVKYGSLLTVKSLMGVKSTIKTLTRSIMRWITWSAFRLPITAVFMPNSSTLNGGTNCQSAWVEFAPLHRHGMAALKGGHGIESMASKHGKIENTRRASVNSVAYPMKLAMLEQAAFAPMPVSPLGAWHQALTMNSVNAPTVDKRSLSIVTRKSAIAQEDVPPLREKRVVAIRHNPLPEAVYNLTINAVPEYFANGVLVHNCDAARYLTWHARYEDI